MTSYQSDFLAILAARGFLYQGSDLEGLDALMSKERISAYIGFDATAKSLHVGSMLPIMMLYWLQQTGHKPIPLMGGGTTKVGDPSGKDESRTLLDEDTISSNLAGIKKVFNKVLHFGDSETDALMANNDDWLSGLAYLPFLRDYGRHFSVNRMLAMDSVRLRLEREQSLSFLEFNYMILQAYDFLELNRRYGVRLQMGGSDQWGNILQGIELGRRVDGVELFALSCPLLTTSSGAKMGKSASGAVWLDEDLLSPYDFWQYWRNTEDADVGRFLKLFTTLPLDECDKLGALQGAEINEAKKRLAFEVTLMLHGKEAAEKAAATAEKTFVAGDIPDDLPGMTLSSGDLEKGVGLLTICVDLGLVSSNSEARRQIKGGGLRVNNEVQTDEARQLGREDITDQGLIKISLGRKRHMVIRVDN